MENYVIKNAKIDEGVIRILHTAGSAPCLAPLALNFLPEGGKELFCKYITGLSFTPGMLNEFLAHAALSFAKQSI